MKQLKDLTLLDKFLFDETMDHPEAHEALLQIILGQEELKLMTPSQTEKEFRTMPWLRSIRVDVYALDQKGTVYDTEMQAEHRTDLAKRSRYYQGLTDLSHPCGKSARFSGKVRNGCKARRRVRISSSFFACNAAFSALLLRPRFYFVLQVRFFRRQGFSLTSIAVESLDACPINSS